MKRLIRLTAGFSRQMSRANVSAYASGAAFFVFLSLIPIIILICSMLPFTPLQKSDLMRAVLIMPEPVVPLMFELIESLYDSTVGMMSMAAIVTVWSASKGMLALMRGLNAMNGVIEDRNYFVQRIIASFYTVVMLAVLLLSLVLMVFGNTLARIISAQIPVLGDLMELLVYLKPLVTWLVLTLVFMVMYAYVPNCRMKLKDQLPGAVFAGLSWNIFSWGFSIYVETFNGMSVYGSLSTIVVIMLWLYSVMYLLLVGAHINRFAAPFRREIMKK